MTDARFGAPPTLNSPPLSPPSTTSPRAVAAGTLTLHAFPLSGHRHRVALMLSLLGLPYRCVDVDLAAGAREAAR